MKATKLITATAVATLGLTLLAPSALAAPTQPNDAKALIGSGDITFTEDSGRKTDPGDPETVDPLDPEKPIGPINPTGGPLRIDFLTDLHFKGEVTEAGKEGQALITTNKGEYNAASAQPVLKDGKTIKRGNYVQVSDYRSAGDDGQAKGWKLSAKMTKQFTDKDAKSVLNGSTISYANPVVTFKDDEGPIRKNLAEDKTKFEATAAVADKALAFYEKGASTEMLTAHKGNGFGTYYLQFGRSEEFDGAKVDSSANSVKLTVPANTPMKATSYVGEITWTLEEI